MEDGRDGKFLRCGAGDRHQQHPVFGFGLEHHASRCAAGRSHKTGRVLRWVAVRDPWSSVSEVRRAVMRGGGGGEGGMPSVPTLKCRGAVVGCRLGAKCSAVV
jgi:hypothetical protein